VLVWGQPLPDIGRPDLISLINSDRTTELWFGSTKGDAIMSILSHISYLIKASDMTETENLRLKQKHGIDPAVEIDPFEPRVIKWTFEERPEENRLEAYLEGLDYDTLLKLETLMYFGRGDGDLKHLRSYLADRKDSKEEIISTIVEKCSAYPSYFRAALNKLKQDGTDADRI
jgi:hypothetical protein